MKRDKYTITKKTIYKTARSEKETINCEENSRQLLNHILVKIYHRKWPLLMALVTSSSSNFPTNGDKLDPQKNCYKSLLRFCNNLSCKMPPGNLVKD